MSSPARRLAAALLVASPAVLSVAPALAQSPALAAPTSPTYADLVDLADSAPLVVHAQVRKFARVGEDRARGLRPGLGRFYVEAQTQALITGRSPLGQSFAYLVDLPLDAKGKPSLRKKDEVIIFARPVAGRPAELQLIQPGAQLAWSAPLEARLRTIITALLSPDAPARVTGVREYIFVPGTLAGEGETQIFLNTADASAASITVRHRPNQPPQWGVSFSELVAAVDRPPERDTLEWYRLACFLRRDAPPSANLSEGYEAQRTADADYRMVMESLGPCRRTMQATA